MLILMVFAVLPSSLNHPPSFALAADSRSSPTGRPALGVAGGKHLVPMASYFLTVIDDSWCILYIYQWTMGNISLLLQAPTPSNSYEGRISLKYLTTKFIGMGHHCQLLHLPNLNWFTLIHIDPPLVSKHIPTGTLCAGWVKFTKHATKQPCPHLDSNLPTKG